jgi:hypothetical protein
MCMNDFKTHVMYDGNRDNGLVKLYRGKIQNIHAVFYVKSSERLYTFNENVKK